LQKTKTKSYAKNKNKKAKGGTKKNSNYTLYLLFELILLK